MFKPTVAIMICIVLASCGRTDNAQQQRLRAGYALRQFMIEIQIALVEQSPTNVVDITKWAKSLSWSSASKPAEELRMVCDVVWIDNNVKDWLLSTNSSFNTAVIAMIGEYQYEGRRYFVGVTFGGKVVQQTGPPKSGFAKLDLQNTPPGKGSLLEE